MLRWTVAGVIVVGLLLGIWLVRPRDGDDPGATTVPVAAETTTTTELTTTTTHPTTTTTLDPTQLRDVETVEQTEAILRELWFGWFEGIYNQDEERIREVVASDEQFEAAREQFGVMEFDSAPSPQGIELLDLEVLRSDSECLVVWMQGKAQFLRSDPTLETVEVLRWGDRWAFYSSWRYRDDLWADDCQAQF